jgi:hypothetical protein
MRIQHIFVIERHRNGICGAPFHVVVFQDHGEESSRKVGIVFDSPYHVAVLDIAKLADGNIAFGSNSWRGDVFELELRAAVTELESSIAAFTDESTRDGGQP